MPHSGQFQKGNPGGPGRPPGRSPSQMVRFNLKMAAREHCERAVQVVAECLEHKDARIRLMAAEIMLERGYGRPEQRADVDVVHQFAVVPQVLDRETWLRTRGQGLLSDGTVPPRPLDAVVTLDRTPTDEPPDKLN
jgi:hypothetical protein